MVPVSSKSSCNSCASAGGIGSPRPERRASIHLSGNTARADASSRCTAPRVLRHFPPPLKNRGRRESRLPVAPMGPVQKHGVAPQVRPETRRLFLRDGFTAYFVLSPVTELFCHRHAVGGLQSLAPASGRQDHMTSPSAGKCARLMHCRVHRISPQRS